MSQGRRHFTDEFKREAVALLVSSGRPLSQIASELGISPSMLRNWRNGSGGRDAGPCAAPRTIRSAARPRRTASRGSDRQPQAGRAGHAPARSPGSGAAPLSPVHNRQQAFSPGGGKPAGSELCRQPAQSSLVGRYHLHSDQRGWLYLAVILDLFTRKVVGWAMRDHMRAELTIAALTMAGESG